MNVKPLALLAAITLLTGCVYNIAYRTEHDQVCNFTTQDKCTSEAYTQSVKDKYSLAFIEFDDQGFLHDPGAKDFVMRQLATDIQPTRPVLMITYIHGWNHNANETTENGDVEKFRTLLTNTALKYVNHDVKGVYLGWRGRSLKWYLNYLTFWDRKNTAHEVGINGITNVLLELEAIVKGTNLNNHNNTMVTIGHSFGGAVLFSAIRPILAERHFSSRPPGSHSSVQGFGDTVALLNPAFEANRYHSLYELSQTGCNPYPDSQIPRLVTLSAAEDLPGRWLFPIGRWLGTILESHRDSAVKDCSKNQTEERYNKMTQKKGDITEIGQHERYVTHLLRKEQPYREFLNSGTEEALKAKASAANARAGEEDYVIGDMVLISKKQTQPYNPYLNVFAQDGIITGHNDVWDREVASFIEELVGITTEANLKLMKK